MLLSRRGQSTAEYAVLFAIVLGAAVAMQQFVRVRLQGATRAGTVQYEAQVDTLFPGFAADPTFSPDRVASTSSGTDVVMDTATKGSVESTSGSTSIETVQ